MVGIVFMDKQSERLKFVSPLDKLGTGQGNAPYGVNLRLAL